MTDPVPGSSAETAAPPSPIGWALTALLREWSARTREAVGDMPQGTRGYQVLREVVETSPRSQAALAAKLGIDRTVMTYLLDSCVESGLVERREDPADRRARRIVATAHGRARLAELDASVARAEQELLAGLAPPERATLCHLLERAATGLIPEADRCAAVAETLE